MIVIRGNRPNWDLEAMVKRSDAVVIVSFTKDLGSKRQPGENEEPPRFDFLFKDFELTVEKFLYPK